MSWRPCFAQPASQAPTFPLWVQKSEGSVPVAMEVRSNYTVADLFYDVVGVEDCTRSSFFTRNGVVLDMSEVLQPSNDLLILTTGIRSGAGHLSLPPLQPREITTIQPESVGDSWRVVHPGLSLRSRCQSPDCPAFNRTIYVNREFGEFQISKERIKIKCPACNVKALPGDNIGFLQARYSIEGETSSELPYHFEGCSPLSSGYTTLIERELTNWVYLQVRVSPLP